MLHVLLILVQAMKIELLDVAENVKIVAFVLLHLKELKLHHYLLLRMMERVSHLVVRRFYMGSWLLVKRDQLLVNNLSSWWTMLKIKFVSKVLVKFHLRKLVNLSWMN